MFSLYLADREPVKIDLPASASRTTGTLSIFTFAARFIAASRFQVSADLQLFVDLIFFHTSRLTESCPAEGPGRKSD